MEIKNFTSLINNLLSCDVYYISDMKKDIGFLKGKINPNNLHMDLSTDYLHKLISSMKDNTYYELINTLGVRLFLFRIENGIVVIGPYLKRSIDENEIIRRMNNNNVPYQLFNVLKSEYSVCAILDSYNIRKVVDACLLSFLNIELLNFEFVKINNFEKPSLIMISDDADEILYDHIYQKYEVENDLLYNIEHGLVENIKDSIVKMQSFQSNKYLDYYLSHPNEAMASLRAMVRIAAVRSGLSIVIIDEILSKYTNLMRKSTTLKESENLIASFEIEITSAVRDYLSHVPPCSPFIKRIAEYIILNYNKDLSLDYLSNKFKISPSYLSRLFKKEINKGVKEFVEEIRVSNACKLIETTDMSISKIGYTVGYIDNNYFTKVFKKQTNMTPSEYKAQLSIK